MDVVGKEDKKRECLGERYPALNRGHFHVVKFKTLSEGGTNKYNVQVTFFEKSKREGGHSRKIVDLKVLELDYQR